jgi:hypothetical protein
MKRGRTAAKPRDVAGLLTLYGVTDPAERDKLLALTREAGVRGWWRQYSDVVPRWMELYTGLEKAASVIRLQTEDYASNVTVQIAPVRAGPHAAAGGPFTILRFPEPDVVYLEQLDSALCLDQPDDIAGYLVVVDQLCVQAATGAASKDMLRALRSELWAAPGRRRSLRAHRLRYAVT